MGFFEDLRESGLVHKPMRTDAINSFDAERKSIKPDKIKKLTEGKTVLSGTPVTYCWPKEMPADGDCAFYGTVTEKIKLNKADLTGYDRLRFKARAVCPGNRINNLLVGLVNEGNIKVPDEYYREGSHVQELTNMVWCDCIWEFGSLSRDKVTEISFNMRLNGKDISTGDEVAIEIEDVRLEKVNNPYKDKGWAPDNRQIAYSYSGYNTKGPKTAVTDRCEPVFYIVSDDTGVSVYEGKPREVTVSGETLYLIDFTEFEVAGRYHIHIGGYRTDMFVIEDNVFEGTTWRLINFLFCERCGYPVYNKHGLCHMDVYAKHDGKIIPFCGGWHDAGDLSQQMLHTAESADALFGLAEQNRDNPELYNRLMEEACWGLDFVLRTRFKDGYRATSAGLVRWTDGFIGNEDDVYVRSHNHAFENLMCSAFCMHAGEALKGYDDELSYGAKMAAKADFDFGIKRFVEEGIEYPIMWEHSLSSSYSLYASVIVIAAARLYREFEDEKYREYASIYLEELLSCQDDSDTPYKGAFYRDGNKKSRVHFNHQSREYLFAMALSIFAQTFTDSPLRDTAVKSIKDYGNYLSFLFSEASAYRMMPAGIYDISEAEDEETFKISHLLVDYDKEKTHYESQVRSGKKLNDNLYLKQFPVWFSFRGNSAVMLALGRAAGVVGNFLQDKSYINMACEQLYFFTGKNPFRQSLIYGEGKRYASQYAVMLGETVGEMPVGVLTDADNDIPYFPHANNATYKEVWTSTVNRFMWVLAEVLKKND